MDYTPYYETMRRTSLLRGMTDAELDTLMACFAPRVRRYAKGELLLMAGYETHEVGLVLEGAITASKPLADGSTVVMARMGPGGVFADVLAGESHYPLSKMLALAFDGITSLSIKPIRFITGFGVFVALVSFIGVLWAVIEAALGLTVSGWASMTSIICFVSGVQLICLGVIGEYIGKIYLESKHRPRYIISDATPNFGEIKEDAQ